MSEREREMFRHYHKAMSLFFLLITILYININVLMTNLLKL